MGGGWVDFSSGRRLFEAAVVAFLWVPVVALISAGSMGLPGCGFRGGTQGSFIGTGANHYRLCREGAIGR